MTQPDNSEPVLDISDLEVRFATPDGELRAVKGVNINKYTGATEGPLR